MKQKLHRPERSSSPPRQRPRSDPFRESTAAFGGGGEGLRLGRRRASPSRRRTRAAYTSSDEGCCALRIPEDRDADRVKIATLHEEHSVE